MENGTVNTSSTTPNADDMNEDIGGSEFQINVTAYIVSLDVIVGLGLIGNVFIIAIMASKRSRSHSYAVYMTLLAISDSCVLIETAVEDNLDNIFDLLRPIYNANLAVCEALLFLKDTFALLSPWVLVAMTFDRYIVIVFPLHKIRLCTRRYSIVACSLLCFVSLAAPTPYLFYTDHIVEDGFKTCIFGNEVITFYWLTVATLLHSVLPVVMLSVLNIHTAVVLRRTVKSTMRRTESRASLNQAKLIKITISLILVSSLSLVALVPFTVVEFTEFILELLDDEGSELFNKLWMLFNVVRLLNYSMNFYILISFSEHYREVVINMFRKPCRKSETPDLEMVNGSRSVYSVTESSNVM